MMFSAISGSGNFISSSFPNQQKYIILAVGALSIITGILSSIFQYMKVSELSEGHRLSYLSWEKFYTNVKFQLRRKDDDRDNILEFINIIIPEYQQLIEISPDIPSHITNIIKKKKKDLDWIHLPFIISDFDKTTPYANRFNELHRHSPKSGPSDNGSDKSSDTVDAITVSRRMSKNKNTPELNQQTWPPTISQPMPYINPVPTNQINTKPSYLPTAQDVAMLSQKILQIPEIVGQMIKEPNQLAPNQQPNNNNNNNITIDVPQELPTLQINQDDIPTSKTDINKTSYVSINLPETISDIGQLSLEQQQAIFTSIMRQSTVSDA